VSRIHGLSSQLLTHKDAPAREPSGGIDRPGRTFVGDYDDVEAAGVVLVEAGFDSGLDAVEALLLDPLDEADVLDELSLLAVSDFDSVLESVDSDALFEPVPFL
jgi:hypothetical protein